MTLQKPFRKSTDPKILALMEKSNAALTSMEALAAEQTREFAEFNRTNPLKEVLGHLLVLDREMVRATDKFSQVVKAENTLSDEQEKLWAVEDKKRK